VKIAGDQQERKGKEIYSLAATAAARPAPAFAVPPPRVNRQRNQPRVSLRPLRSKSGVSALAALKVLILLP
jgi:hypothetical protein